MILDLSIAGINAPRQIVLSGQSCRHYNKLESILIQTRNTLYPAQRLTCVSLQADEVDM